MDEGEAREGGEGRGGEGARAMDRHDDALTHRSCCPTPPLNLQVNNEVNNQLAKRSGPASAVREGRWEDEGAVPSIASPRRPIPPMHHKPIQGWY